MNYPHSFTNNSSPEELEQLLSDLFLRVDYNGNIIDLIAGYSENHLNSKTGIRLYDLFPDYLASKLYDIILKVVQRNTVISFTYNCHTGTRKFRFRILPSANDQVIIISKQSQSQQGKRASINRGKRSLSLWNNSKDGMRIIDKHGTIIAVNDAYCKLVDMSEEELKGKKFQDVYISIGNEEKIKLIQRFEKQFSERRMRQSFETKILLHNNKSKFVEVINTFITGEETISGGKKELLLLSIFRDITKQKEAQQTEKLLAEIVDSSHDAIIGNSLNGIIASWNTGAEKIFGYTKEEVKGLSVSFLFPPERNDEISGILNRLRKGERIDNYETICITRDGSRIYISATFSPIKDSSHHINGISIIARDVTDKKTIEQTLRESEERYRSLVETSPDAILLVNFEGQILMGNRLITELLGFISGDELLGRNIFDFIPKEEHRKLLRNTSKIMNEGSLKNSEYKFRDKNNNIIPIEVSASLIFNNMGVPEAIIAVVRDISERKTAEEALKNSELQFRSVWENSNDGMRLTDEEGTIVAVNRAFCRLTETEEINLVGKPFNVVYDNKDNSYIEDSLKLYRKNFLERNFVTTKQSRSKFCCGKTVELEVTYSAIEFEQGKPLLLAIFHDITERKKVEEELRNNEKHAAVGKMAAYLSHEIKTPLASIKMNIDMLSKSLELPRDKQKSFNIIQKEVKRLNNLLKNVLQFSRQVDLVFVHINLFNLVNNIKDLLEPALKEKQINFINNNAGIFIKGDYQKLQSVFLHMIENSIEAITGRGEIEISSVIHPGGKYTSVFIRDTGAGITLQPQIFDPFFTTKAAGTGLGLSIAQKIIEQHNGKIELVSSRQGETIFKITLLNY